MKNTKNKQQISKMLDDGIQFVIDDNITITKIIKQKLYYVIEIIDKNTLKTMNTTEASNIEDIFKYFDAHNIQTYENGVLLTYDLEKNTYSL